ncbi:MAG: HRDC domain-containing protein [Acidimicrobiia bacterium]|nr:HRDC domain-containing protein [Acidimicrobiia bacterium]
MDTPPDDARLIVDDDRLAEVVEQVRAADRYALDTEFHRERTYFPKLALVQLAWGDGELVLIDPLEVDVRALAPLLDGPGLAILHAASQDLEVLELACGTIPAQLFDTQMAAAFVGYGQPSLSDLHDRLLGGTLPKGNRLTDWLRRPLSQDQLTYAASDVARLVEMANLLLADLDRRGRRRWVEDECELMRSRARTLRDPDEAWTRIREVRHLRGQAVGVARAVAAWRERRAAEIDQPTRHVLADLAVATIAQRAPSTDAELRKLRGVEERFVRGSAGEQLLAAVREGLAAEPPRSDRANRTEVPRELRGAVSLLSAWVAQRGRDLAIDTALLATRNDLEELLAGAEGARLATGWRAELIGGQIKALVEGGAALAFDASGQLRLERRSGEALPAL